MRKIWYLSPSNQSGNIGINGYGNECDQMYRLVYEITPHLDRAGVSFCVPAMDVTVADRCRESNKLGAAFHLALHSNAGGGGKAWGPVGLYFSEEGQAFCRKLVDRLLEIGQKSNRSAHLVERKNLYELKHTAAPAALLEVDFHDSAVGVEFLTTRRGEIAEAIARVIIEADGKNFVPATNGEQLEEAVKLGFFPRNTCWDDPITKEETALLALKLKRLLERG